MILLGIESSCDETGVAVLKADSTTNTLTILSNSLSSSLSLHAATGGIIPEVAAREQLKYMPQVLKDALSTLDKNEENAVKKVDAIAVTYGPGLIGSLLVGVETARTLSYLYDIPLIPVNHMLGHIYANWIQTGDKRHSISDPKFPALALVVSGGHTDLVVLKGHGDYAVLGGTRDDAAGEAFDKIGRLLNLPYPAGPVIATLAKKGDPKAFRFPRPMWDSKDYNFSFSGLKTAVLNEVRKSKKLSTTEISNICASTERAITDVLVKKTILAATEYKVKSILLGGGVAANESLQASLKAAMAARLPGTMLFIPPKELCTDNAAMVAAAGYFLNDKVSWKTVSPNPELYY